MFFKKPNENRYFLKKFVFTVQACQVVLNIVQHNNEKEHVFLS